MKAIKVTTLNKSKNSEFFQGNAVGSIVAKSLPSTYYGVEVVNGYYFVRADLHLQDGFKDIIEPTYNSSTQKKTSTIIDNPNDEDTYTYEVVDKTTEEIQNELIANAQSEQQQIIQQTLETQVVEQAQTMDDTESLDNADVFPIWLFPFAYTVDFKCQHFNAENELVLYKCVQAHTSQSDWKPKDVPALFTRVAYPNEVPVWVQPTGAQDAYQIGDIVWFPTVNSQKWISKINANTTVPDGDVPFNRYWEPYNL